MSPLPNASMPGSGTPNVGQRLREHVAAYMTGLDIQVDRAADGDTTPHGHRAERFYKYWRVRGNEGAAVFATYADNDDVIEFGLSERVGSTLTNILHASLVLDDDRGELNVMSESSGELNFDAVVDPNSTAPLQCALRYFGEVFRGD